MLLQKKRILKIQAERPYDFELTVHKPAGWTLFSSSEIYENKTLWTGLRIDGEPLGLKIGSTGKRYEPTLVVEVFSRARLTKEMEKIIRETLESKLSTSEDLKDFYRMASKDDILKHVITDLYGMHSTDDANLFSIALLAITLQMAPLKRSQDMLEALGKNYGEKITFDGKKLRISPTSRKIASINPSVLKARCNLGYRAKNIVNMARTIEAGFPSLEELKAMPADVAKKKLMSLPGIGDYSSDIINPNGGFPIDVWSADVFGKLFYGKEPKNGRDDIDRIKKEGLRRWGKWSWYAFFYVVNDLANLSKVLRTNLRLQ